MMTKLKNLSLIKKILLLLLLILFICVSGFLIWASLTFDATSELKEQVNIEEIHQEDSWMIFAKDTYTQQEGIIIYPGAKVEPEAYSYLGQELANQGYLVAIPSVTLNLSIFNLNKAEEIISEYPNLEWYIGGHSMGGAAAAMFADEHLDLIEGLFFLGSYPGGSVDLSQESLPVLSIYGELDGLSTPEKVDAAAPLLPPDTFYEEIIGGNHAQFGWYGEQKGDNPAQISTIEQQDQIIDALLSWLESLENE
ncbi:alpha/beta hydrolase [Alkalihalobacillus trypoxylicola]|nr:alpha/beta hydrolase [Alkalihalobacillus trypoxylicola]